MAIIYLKNRNTIPTTDEKAKEIKKLWLDRNTDLSDDLIIENWRVSFKDIAKIELDDRIDKEKFSKQDVAQESDYIKQIIEDSNTTLEAQDFFLKQKKVWNGTAVIDPENYIRWKEVFNFVRRSIGKEIT